MGAPREFFELTSPQSPIWRDLKYRVDPASFQHGGYSRIAGVIDLALARRAVELVTARHDALRLRIDGEMPRQWVEASPGIAGELHDFSGEPDPEAAFLTFAEAEFHTPMPLDGTPLVRFTLAAAGEELAFLMVRCHHLVMDGVSAALLMRRVLETYSSLTGFGPPELAPRSSYLEFAAEDRAYRASPRHQQDLAYWRARLAGLPDPNFAARQRAAAETTPAEHRPVRWRLGRERYDRFLATCRAVNTRPVQALLALAASLVLRETGMRDVVIGLAVAGRGTATMETLGMFANWVPVRLALDPAGGWPAALAQVEDALKRDLLHQRTPIDAICSTLGLPRERRAPFEVVLCYMPAELNNYPADWAEAPIEITRFTGPEPDPLVIYVVEDNRSTEPVMNFAFNPANLSYPEAVRLQQRFERLLEAFIAEPAVPLGRIELPAETTRTRR